MGLSFGQAVGDVGEMPLEVAEKPLGDFIGAFSHAEVLELDGLEPTIAAGLIHVNGVKSISTLRDRPW
jgi:hypothetical protein